MVARIGDKSVVGSQESGVRSQKSRGPVRRRKERPLRVAQDFSPAPGSLVVRCAACAVAGDDRRLDQSRGHARPLRVVDSKMRAVVCEEIRCRPLRCHQAFSGVRLAREQVMAHLVRERATHRTPEQRVPLRQRHVFDAPDNAARSLQAAPRRLRRTDELPARAHSGCRTGSIQAWSGHRGEHSVCRRW